ncbi:hypothetical protein OH768_31335 [Streptomyces sp. NBC_01622]|uniref:hypothetical protein n=1 Tax=Streptomyces sp. NBC_01622 TaxID=2975903 RepID=UPI0038652FBC|nr:hypothetical protein OH768_31335 [Streptomyces sp. NBC_01622]
MAITLTLADQDKATLRTAAYGAVSLMAAAGAAGSPHRIAARGSIALTSSTGQVGHVLAEKSKIGGLSGRSVAELADQVLPALTATMRLLGRQDPAEADNFRTTVTLAVEESVRTVKGEPGPIMTEMIRKITGVLDAV